MTFGKPMTTTHFTSESQPMSVTIPLQSSDQTLCTRMLPKPIESDAYPAMSMIPGSLTTDFMYPSMTSRRRRKSTPRMKKESPQNCARNTAAFIGK